MEEKRRYVWVDRETTFDSDKLYDRTNGKKYDPVYAIDLLNQQDGRIKELENELLATERIRLENLYEGCRCVERDSKRIKELEQENLSLQEQSIRDNQNWIEEVERLNQLQKQLAIEVLEKMKNYFDDRDDDKYDESEGWIITNRNVIEYVDNQIKKLKGEE